MQYFPPRILELWMLVHRKREFGINCVTPVICLERSSKDPDYPYIEDLASENNSKEQEILDRMRIKLVKKRKRKRQKCVIVNLIN